MPNTLLKDTKYVPSQDEIFMNDAMLSYFKNELLEWEKVLLKDIKIAKAQIKDFNQNLSKDESDLSVQDVNTIFYLESIQRDTRLLKLIGFCLERIKNRTYGYCLYTQEPIELKRLQANPVAIYSLEAQEMMDKK